MTLIPEGSLTEMAPPGQRGAVPQQRQGPGQYCAVHEGIPGERLSPADSLSLYTPDLAPADFFLFTTS